MSSFKPMALECHLLKLLDCGNNSNIAFVIILKVSLIYFKKISKHSIIISWSFYIVGVCLFLFLKPCKYNVVGLVYVVYLMGLWMCVYLKQWHYVKLTL